MEDVIIDVIVNGRVLLLQEIPLAVTKIIETTLAKEEPPQEIQYEGVYYWWSIRPCVYPENVPHVRLHFPEGSGKATATLPLCK